MIMFLSTFDDLSDDQLSNLADDLSDLAGGMIAENGFEIEISCGQGDCGDVTPDDLSSSIFDLAASVSLN